MLPFFLHKTEYPILNITIFWLVRYTFTKTVTYSHSYRFMLANSVKISPYFNELLLIQNNVLVPFSFKSVNIETFTNIPEILLLW